MLQKIRIIIGYILLIIVILFLLCIVCIFISTEDPEVNKPLPVLNKQEQKTVETLIEEQALPMPGINQ